MIFIKKTKEDINMKFVDEVVRAYFSCLKSKDFVLSASEISELLRHSMCKLLSLESKGASSKIENYSKFIVNSLCGILKSYNIDEMSDDYKKGLLEACVHCMEMSRKKANL